MGSGLAMPAWAAWNDAGAERPWTVGIEEEAMLLEPAGWALANRVDDVLAAVTPGLEGRATAETHACVVELATLPQLDVPGAVADLRRLRRELARTLARLGMCAAVGGTHPSAVWTDVATSSAERYRAIDDTMRVLARREPTFALHVHVAVPDGDAAARALCGLREELPLLLALSANSPFWQGRDTGMASARAPVFSMFPRVGIPGRFETYRAYVRAVDALVAPGAVPDPSFLWWDARLQPRLGTIEVRVMDGQAHARDAAALAALVQCLVRVHAERAPHRAVLAPEALAENRFLASRDGIDAWLIERDRPYMRPARARLAEVLDECRPVAAALGCADDLEGVVALADAPGHARQRAVAAESGLDGVMAALGAAFDPAPNAVTTV